MHKMCACPQLDFGLAVRHPIRCQWFPQRPQQLVIVKPRLHQIIYRIYQNNRAKVPAPVV